MITGHMVASLIDPMTGRGALLGWRHALRKAAMPAGCTDGSGSSGALSTESR